ncbi:MAG: hypothetical protein AAGJ09_02745 [Pseudomonadota bacterium]
MLDAIVRSLGTDLPAWIAAISAAFGVFFGLKQLRLSAEAQGQQADAHQDQVNIARAHLLLEVDRDFESQFMAESRIAIRSLRNACVERANSENDSLTDAQLSERERLLFSEQINRLYQNYKKLDDDDASTGEEPLEPYERDDPLGDRYATFMRLPYWMETVGHLTQRGLLSKDDVLELYDALLIGVLGCFQNHIAYRQEEPPLKNGEFLKYALWLKEEAVARLDSRNAVAVDVEREKEAERADGPYA